MRLTALDIYQQDFRKRFRGYDVNEVDSFLEVVARDFEELVQENNTLRNRIAALEEQIQEYRRKEASIHEALLSVEKYGEEARQVAERETELMLREARLQAEEILRDAQEKAAQIEAQIVRLQQEKRRFIAQYQAALEAQQTLLEELERMDFTVESPTALSEAESQGALPEPERSSEPALEPDLTIDGDVGEGEV